MAGIKELIKSAGETTITRVEYKEAKDGSIEIKEREYSEPTKWTHAYLLKLAQKGDYLLTPQEQETLETWEGLAKLIKVVTDDSSDEVQSNGVQLERRGPEQISLRSVGFIESISRRLAVIWGVSDAYGLTESQVQQADWNKEKGKKPPIAIVERMSAIAALAMLKVVGEVAAKNPDVVTEALTRLAESDSVPEEYKASTAELLYELLSEDGDEITRASMQRIERILGRTTTKLMWAATIPLAKRVANKL